MAMSRWVRKSRKRERLMTEKELPIKATLTPYVEAAKVRDLRECFTNPVGRKQE